MRKKDAFTLIELLTVIGVIGILAAISFGISTGVSERQARTKAAAEMSGIAAALEAYRTQYGTYPITDDPEELLQALANQREWNSDGNGGIEETYIDPDDEERRAFIDSSRFLVEGFNDGSTEFGAENQQLLDPWENPYYYEFQTDGSWQRFGYVLFSRGSDGDMTAPVNGIIDKSAAGNSDNIYLDD